MNIEPRVGDLVKWKWFSFGEVPAGSIGIVLKCRGIQNFEVYWFNQKEIWTFFGGSFSIINVK